MRGRKTASLEIHLDFRGAVFYVFGDPEHDAVCAKYSEKAVEFLALQW